MNGLPKSLIDENFTAGRNPRSNLPTNKYSTLGELGISPENLPTELFKELELSLFNRRHQ